MKNTNTLKTLLLATSVALGLLANSSSQAALITYQPTQFANFTIANDDTQILTNGAPSRAYTFSTGNSVTINGVNFTPFANQTVDTVSAPGGISDFGGFALQANLNANYRALVTGAIFSNNNSAVATFTFNNLTIGTPYVFQLWAMDDRALANGRALNFSGGPNISYNIGGIDGGFGQYAIGSFVADATFQSITLTPTGPNTPSLISAVQLRVVPEPTTALMLGIAGALFAFRRRFVARS